MGSSNETSCFGPVINRRGGARARTRRWCRAARPAARRRRWRRICASARPAPTPAARSASRRRSPASSASSRPTAAARAGASSRSRPRSIRPGRSRARCATPRSCCARWRATIRRTPPRSIIPVPDYEAAVGKSVKGMRIGIPKEYRIDGMPAEIEKLWEQGADVAEGRRRRDRRGVAAAHQIRAAGLLHRGAGGGLVQSRALRRRALRPARAGPRRHRHVREHARRGLRQGGAPAHHDRHLCALRRLLRRLLPARAEGAHADQAAISRTASPRASTRS